MSYIYLNILFISWYIFKFYHCFIWSCWLLQVVLASVPDLQSGFSRELFSRWCEDKKNTIILTNRTTKGTLARQLIENSTLKQIDVEVGSSGIENVYSFAMGFPELLNQYLTCCHLLYVPGNSRTMHCGIFFKVFYLISFRFSWICYIPVSLHIPAQFFFPLVNKLGFHAIRKIWGSSIFGWIKLYLLENDDPN